MITQPEHVTKDRLKSELKRHGVSFTPNENKDYYVQLYRRHVLRGKGGQQKGQRSEFSSDEELVARRSPRQGRRQQQQQAKRLTKTTKIDSYLGQVARLSDQELLEELRAFGESPGPVTDTTRAVYQRQLARHMADKAKVSTHARGEVEEVDEGTDEDHMGEWSSEESEEEEEEAGVRRKEQQVPKSSPSKRYVHQTYSSPGKTYVESTYVRERVTERRDRAPRPSAPARVAEAPRQAVARERVHREPKEGGGVCSFFFSFLLLVLVFVATFLAYNYYTEREESLLAHFSANTAEAIARFLNTTTG